VAFWEPFVAWGFILGLLSFFQRRFARLTGAWPSLARRAFLIYIIHPPIVVGTALAWRDVAAPALAKFLITGSLACALCYLVAGLPFAFPPLHGSSDRSRARFHRTSPLGRCCRKTRFSKGILAML